MYSTEPEVRATNLWFDLMRLAEAQRGYLLSDLRCPMSTLTRQFGPKMCGLWALLVEECLIQWNRQFTRKAGRARSWKRNPATGIKRPSEIDLSWPLFRDSNIAEFKETVLHELAHVMTPGAKHGPLWKTVALAIGSNGHRCHEIPPPRRRTNEDKLLDRANALVERLRHLEKE